MNWTANPYQYATLHQVTSNGGDVPCKSRVKVGDARESFPCDLVSRHVA